MGHLVIFPVMKDLKSDHNYGFKIVKAYNIYPKYTFIAFIKFCKRDKSKPVQGSNPRPIDC